MIVRKTHGLRRFVQTSPRKMLWRLSKRWKELKLINSLNKLCRWGSGRKLPFSRKGVKMLRSVSKKRSLLAPIQRYKSLVISKRKLTRLRRYRESVIEQTSGKVRNWDRVAVSSVSIQCKEPETTFLVFENFVQLEKVADILPIIFLLICY